MKWSDVAAQAPQGLKLLGAALAATGVGAPAGALVGGIGMLIEQAIGKEPTPVNVQAALTDPAAVARLMELQESNRAAFERLTLEHELAVLREGTARMGMQFADVRDARDRDKVILAAGKTNHRANAMLAVAYIGLFACIGLMLHFSVDANTAIGGVLMMASGKFLGMVGTGFDFEFGSSSSSRAKDETLAAAAKGAAKP